MPETGEPAAESKPLPMIHWKQGAQAFQARWRSEREAPPPQRVESIDDTVKADAAYRMACEGTALMWSGDFQNARQLLQALGRRAEQSLRRPVRAAAAAEQVPGATFHRHRQAQAQRARVLSQLLIPLDAQWVVPLRRAPDVSLACRQAWGSSEGQGSVVSLRELLALISASEWRKKGLAIPALGPGPDQRIHPHYGVFSPVRGEYVDLVAQASLPPGALDLSWDIGTGTGVLAATLARRGVRQVVATELDPRALACAQENIERLNLSSRVTLVQADLYPPQQTSFSARAALVVCNPPWLPARAGSSIERAVYDEDSRMLRGFLDGLAPRLLPQGEAWLILSDLAEHLGLRTREQLLGWIAGAGLQVLGRLDTRPRHRKASDAEDPLHAQRAKEVTSLWRLGALT